MIAVPLPAALAFHLSFLLLVALVFPKPRLHVYSVLATFLTLGFWAKFALFTVLNHPLNEPVGSFTGTPAEWSRGLFYATAGALGAALARIVHLATTRRATGTPIGAERPEAPAWFRRHRGATWALSAATLLAVTLWNEYASIYKIGLHPRVVLPGPANAALAWMLVLGAPLWIALVLEWERFSLRDRAGWLWVAIVEGVVSSVSMLSRAVYLLRILPYALVALEDQTFDSPRGRRNAALFSAVGACFFAISLAGVSLLRLAKYPSLVIPTPSIEAGGTTRPPEAGTAAGDDRATAKRRLMFREVIGLVTDRWVGLEGVLAVSSWPERGASLFFQALVEDPRRGARSTYQRVTGFTYRVRPGVTFLTLPGIIAVLAYSGSFLAVFLGMAGATALALATEVFARQTVGSELVCAVAGTGLAYALCQTNFPYLTGIFVVELWTTLVVFAGLRSRARRGS